MNLGERIIYVTSLKDYNLGSINYIPVDNAFVESYIHSVVIETGGWIHGRVFVGERLSKASFLRFMNILLYFPTSTFVKSEKHGISGCGDGKSRNAASILILNDEYGLSIRHRIGFEISLVWPYPSALTLNRDGFIVAQRAVSEHSQNPSAKSESPSAVSQMLFMGYLLKFLAYFATITAICGLAILALLSVYLPVYWGVFGFPLALIVWWVTIVADDHVLRWGFG
jgi:hypothetical protein